ncbi:MAG: GNAT family N-acetyltransferase [Rhizobiaceae bacterium]
MGEFCLETERLLIRNWREQDRDLFYLINSDDKVMEFFPFRRDRATSDELMDILRDCVAETGYGFTPIILKETDQAIGFCGLADINTEDGFPGTGVEIGWRLATEHWQKGYVTEAARKLLEFAFFKLEKQEIVSFAVHDNYRSFAVMKRLGMKRDPSRDFNHKKVPDTHPHLKRHLVYSLSRKLFTDIRDNSPYVT